MTSRKQSEEQQLLFPLHRVENVCLWMLRPARLPRRQRHHRPDRRGTEGEPVRYGPKGGEETSDG